MSDPSRILCPHCHVEIAQTTADTDFWIRCSGCGRRVMPRSWSRIVSDPEPAALFRPATKEIRISHATARQFGERHPARPNRRITLNRVIALAVPSSLASASACMFFSTFYTTSDLLISGFLGMLLTVFIVIVPSLLVSVGTGAITLAFFGASFGFAGNEFYRGGIYFLFGFALAGFIQIVNANMARVPVEPASSHVDEVESPYTESALHAGVSSSPV